VPALPRPSVNGSVITPMNRPMASNVVCCAAVAPSPEICVMPAGVKPPNTSGMPPFLLKKPVTEFATFCWLMFNPVLGGPMNSSDRFR
jgi:hypothetical protein